MKEQPESELEKRERLRRKLEEAAAEYQEDRTRGWVEIGFNTHVRKEETNEIQVWYYEPRQVAEVTPTEVIFAEGDAFLIEFVEDVLPIPDL